MMLSKCISIRKREDDDGGERKYLFFLRFHPISLQPYYDNWYALSLCFCIMCISKKKMKNKNISWRDLKCMSACCSLIINEFLFGENRWLFYPSISIIQCYFHVHSIQIPSNWSKNNVLCYIKIFSCKSMIRVKQWFYDKSFNYRAIS